MTEPDLNPQDLHIHLDPVGGAAGDMFVAALLDAFPVLTDRVLSDISAVLPEAIGAASTKHVMKSGIRASGFSLQLADGAQSARHGADTTYKAMRALLEAANLSPGTQDAACAILHRIAKAEAHVHNIPIDQVHFHEIADWDSLVDVTAAGSICAALDGASWSLAPLPLGGGVVDTAHGKLPVPAPATVEILKGFQWHDDGIFGERVTPTGAAILAHLTQGHPATIRKGVMCASGYGAGTRDLKGAPNVLRVNVFETLQNEPIWRQDTVIQLACDIDDMTGEEMGAAAEHLRLQDGVLDLVLLTGQGKKSRPMTRFELLVTHTHADQVAAEVFICTSTLGVRQSHVDRLILPRAHEEGPMGTRRKRAQRPDGTETLKIESESLSNTTSLASRRKIGSRVEHD